MSDPKNEQIRAKYIKLGIIIPGYKPVETTECIRCNGQFDRIVGHKNSLCGPCEYRRVKADETLH